MGEQSPLDDLKTDIPTPTEEQISDGWLNVLARAASAEEEERLERRRNHGRINRSIDAVLDHLRRPRGPHFNRRI
jgi:hypothetical protein